LKSQERGGGGNFTGTREGIETDQPISVASRSKGGNDCTGRQSQVQQEKTQKMGKKGKSKKAQNVQTTLSCPAVDDIDG